MGAGKRREAEEKSANFTNGREFDSGNFSS